MDFGGENYNGSFPKLEIRGRVPKRERIYNCCWRKETAAAAVEKKEGEQVLVDEGSQKSEERETLLVKENVVKGSDDDVEEKTQETAAAATGDHVEEKTAQVKEVEDEGERESSTQDEESEKSKHEHTMIKKSDDDDDEKTAQVTDFEDEQEREGRDDESQKSENEHMIKKSHDDDKNEEKSGDDNEIAGDDEQEETDSLSQQLKLLLKLPTNPMIKKSDDEGERETSVSRERGFGGHHTCQIFFGTIPAVVHIHADQPSEFVPESSQPDADHLLQQAAAITAPTNQVEREDGDERETVGEEDVKREEEEVMSFGGKNYEELFPKIEIKARMSKRERRSRRISIPPSLIN